MTTKIIDGHEVEVLEEWTELRSERIRERCRIVRMDGEKKVLRKKQFDVDGEWKDDPQHDSEWQLTARERDFVDTDEWEW